MSSSEEHKAMVTAVFIDQSYKDIKQKLQKLEGLQDKSLRDLVQVAEKVYHNREIEEEKEERKQKEQEARKLKTDKRQERNLHKILATVVRETREPSKTVLSNQRELIAKDQWAYCKGKGNGPGTMQEKEEGTLQWPQRQVSWS